MNAAFDTPTPPAGFSVRNDLRPGDLGRIISLHGTLYAREYGFDHTFETYVAGPLAEFALAPPDSGRLWIAECGEALAGCVAVVGLSETEAQLRWFLVDTECRGRGLGRWLLDTAVAYGRGRGWGSLVLWTVSALTDAARLYRSAGFERVDDLPCRRWGVEVVEEKYVRRLT